MKILAIVPAYNEEKNIRNVIADLKLHNHEMDIIVVNDCSKDQTAHVAEKTGQARVANLLINLGIGGGVQTGFIYARKNGYDIAFQFDGDGQHLAEEINKIISPLIKGEADVVIGSRFLKEGQGFKSTFLRRIGIKIFEILNSLLIRQKVTDNTSGFRAYNQAAFSFLADNYPEDFPEPEAVVLLGRNGFRIREVFVKMQERQGGQSSIFGLKSIYFMIKVIFAIIMTAIRRKIRR